MSDNKEARDYIARDNGWVKRGTQWRHPVCYSTHEAAQAALAAKETK